MSRQSTDLEEEYEAELEDEFEAESETELEEELEDEAFLGLLGGLASGIGGMLGAGGGQTEIEGEAEWEEEAEAEGEDFFGSFGDIARTVGGLLGGSAEGEYEEEYEAEAEYEGEVEGEAEEEAEEFFRGLSAAFRRAAPFLRTLAKTAGPLVATAVGGPAAGALARAVTSQLEGEMEDEVEAEFEEMATAPLTGGQALGEYLAGKAAASDSEAESEALAGVAAYVSLSARDRRDLESMLPALLRGAAVVTRLLHGNRRTRQVVRLMPGIVDGAARTILRRAASGQPTDPVEIGRVLGATTSHVLGSGPARRAVMRRHARGLAHAHRRYRGGSADWYGPGRRYGQRRYGPYGRRTYYDGMRRPGRMGPSAIRRQPVRSRTVGGAARVPRPRPGIVRVVTPVRIPARDGRPTRTVRLVSDVRVPRGAVPAGRPVSVGGRRPRGR